MGYPEDTWIESSRGKEQRAEVIVKEVIVGAVLGIRSRTRVHAAYVVCLHSKSHRGNAYVIHLYGYSISTIRASPTNGRTDEHRAASHIIILDESVSP